MSEAADIEALEESSRNTKGKLLDIGANLRQQIEALENASRTREPNLGDEPALKRQRHDGQGHPGSSPCPYGCGSAHTATNSLKPIGSFDDDECCGGGCTNGDSGCRGICGGNGAYGGNYGSCSGCGSCSGPCSGCSSCGSCNSSWAGSCGGSCSSSCCGGNCNAGGCCGGCCGGGCGQAGCCTGGCPGCGGPVCGGACGACGNCCGCGGCGNCNGCGCPGNCACGCGGCGCGCCGGCGSCGGPQSPPPPQGCNGCDGMTSMNPMAMMMAAMMGQMIAGSRDASGGTEHSPSTKLLKDDEDDISTYGSSFNVNHPNYRPPDMEQKPGITDKRFVGRIKFWFETKGFGFIESEEFSKVFGGDSDVFLHHFQKRHYQRGDLVEFSVFTNFRGKPQGTELRRAKQ